jgi:hypothetical protein
MEATEQSPAKRRKLDASLTDVQQVSQPAEQKGDGRHSRAASSTDAHMFGLQSLQCKPLVVAMLWKQT